MSNPIENMEYLRGQPESPRISSKTLALVMLVLCGHRRHLGDEIIVVPSIAVQNCHPSPDAGKASPKHTKTTPGRHIELQQPVFKKTWELAAVPSTETPDAVEGIWMVLGPLCGKK